MGAFAYTACPDCGVALAALQVQSHECDLERRIAYQVAKARVEIDEFETELSRFLETSRGKFELWYAERNR